jgi:uncharacterized protein YqjF (DUF2071 family)
VTIAGILDTLARQQQLVDEVAERPWPLPQGPWLEAQTRRDALLAFWRVEPDELARLLPPEVAVDAHDASAWAGIGACRVAGLRLRGLPPLLGLSSFPQVEAAACVTAGDRPGLWLFSLEVPKGLLVEAAKRVHRLPAYRARVTASPRGYDAVRDGRAFHARYAPRGAPRTAEPGSLEHFLTERFALYTADGGRLYRAELHHRPWLLQDAEVTVEAATLAPLTLEGAPTALYAEQQDMLVWPLEEVSS